MDPSRVSHDVHGLAERLVSLDPVQYDSVVNEYFEANVSYESRGVVLHGASQLKKYLNVASYIAFDSHLVGQTLYNSHTQTAHIAFQRTFYLPTVPRPLPYSDRINAWLNKQHFRTTFDSELHFNSSQEEGEEPKLYVTKVGPVTRRGAFLVEKLLPYFLLRPIIALFILVLANILGFFHRHTWHRDGPIKLALAALAESWAWYKDAPIDPENYPRPIRQAQDLSDNLTKIVTDGIHTAQQAAQDVSTRAKDLGLPIEQGQQLFEFGIHLPGNAIHTASNITHQAIHTVGVIEQQSVHAVSSIAHSAYHVTTDTAVSLTNGTIDRIETRVKSLGVPVDQYKDQAVKNVRDAAEWFGLAKAKAQEQAGRAQATITELPRRGPDTITGTATSADIGFASEPAQTDEPGQADPVPRLPTGGHDPSAQNAPSYAQAAHVDA